MIKLLLIGIIIINIAKELKKNDDNIKILNYLGTKDNVLMIKILEKQTSPKRFHNYYSLDKSMDDLCFLGDITINGITRNVTVIAPPQTKIGEVHMIRGWLYPSFGLFLPNPDDLYHFEVRKGYWIPYLRSKVILTKNSL